MTIHYNYYYDSRPSSTEMNLSCALSTEHLCPLRGQRNVSGSSPLRVFSVKRFRMGAFMVPFGISSRETFNGRYLKINFTS